jgi:thiamine biosynthesis lipoprotein
MKLKMLSLFVVTLLCVMSCSDEKEVYPYARYTIKGRAQGTTYLINYIDSFNRGKQIQKQVDSILDIIDNSLSNYNPNSLVSKFNRSDTCMLIDEHLLYMFLLSNEINSITDGAYDPTVKPLVNLWGFGDSPMNFDTFFTAPRYTLIRDSLIARYKDSLAYDLLDFVGFEYLLLDGDIKYNTMKEMTTGEFEDNYICKDDSLVQIGFNAMAQGYSADVVGDFLNFKLSIGDYLVEIGGEITAQGVRLDGKPWRVRVESPDINNPTIQSGLADIDMDEFRSIAVSGNYRNYIKDKEGTIGHCIDPRTGHASKNKIISVTVVADEAAVADAYATAFMVMDFAEIIMIVSGDEDLDVFFIFENEFGALESYASYNLEDIFMPVEKDSVQ